MNAQDNTTRRAPVLLSRVEELVNTATHGVGLVLSLAGAGVLVGCVLSGGDIWLIVGCSVYAATLVAVYTASTLSHAISNPRLRHLFRTLDQGFIFLLIVGTFTPIALAYLRFEWCWWLLGLMWAIALVGFVSKILFSHRVDKVSIWIYLLLGWMPILGVVPMMQLIPSGALRWMLIGGLCYTIGTAFLILDQRVLHFHAVWHLFVVAGSACHYFAILFFVALIS